MFSPLLRKAVTAEYAEIAEKNFKSGKQYLIQIYLGALGVFGGD
jgi:hypothetical protein